LFRASCGALPKRLRQTRKHRHKLTWWVGAKKEHQLIRKEDPSDMDQPKDDPKVVLEKIKETPPKENHPLQHGLAPYGTMEKEFTFTPYIY